MLLIVGGAARTGKGILARRLLVETRLPYLSLDVLKMGLVNGLPDFGIDPEASATELAGQLWPLVRAMAVNMVETDVYYIIEGEILPEHAEELRQRFPEEVRACFLGYERVAPLDKLAAIRQFGGHPNDWIADYPDEYVLNLIEQNIAFSRYLRGECERTGFPYFDVSESFVATHNRAYYYLLEGRLPQD